MRSHFSFYKGDYMWYKVIHKGLIVDLLKNPSWIKYQEEYNLKLFCEENEAQGVLSSDQNTVYDLNEYSLLGISQKEYQQLKIKMRKNKNLRVATTQKYNGGNPNERVYEFATGERAEINQLKEKVNTLSEENNELKNLNSELIAQVTSINKSNKTLEDCLLELSEIIYK